VITVSDELCDLIGYWIRACAGTTQRGTFMTIELKMLALSIVLGLVQIVLSA
jgi:hypothetical protein